MTLEEAINTIDIAIAEVEWCYPMEYAEAFEMAKEAIEKQIPKKPILCSDRRKTDYKCPCGQVLYKVYETGMAMGNKFKYCEYCGQKLDWSETE